MHVLVGCIYWGIFGDYLARACFLHVDNSVRNRVSQYAMSFWYCTQYVGFMPDMNSTSYLTLLLPFVNNMATTSPQRERCRRQTRPIAKGSTARHS